MAKVSEECLDEMWSALARYKAEIDQSDLATSTKNTRYQEARFFVRWLDGNYVPGQGLPEHRRRV